MQKTLTLKLLPSEAANEQSVKNYIAKTEGVKRSTVTGYNILKSSIDARSKNPWVNLTIQAFIDEPTVARQKNDFSL